MRAFTNQRFQTTDCRRAVCVVCLVFILSALFCVPYWLKFEFVNDGLRETEIGASPQFKSIVHFWLYLPCVYLVPFAILIVSNTYLIVKLVGVKRRRRHLFSQIYMQTSAADNNTDLQSPMEPLSSVGATDASLRLRNNRSFHTRTMRREMSVTRTETMLLSVVFFFFICRSFWFLVTPRMAPRSP